jgi:hypothetical protein
MIVGSWFVGQKLNSLMEYIIRFYSNQGISFDDSYVKEVRQYYESISASQRTRSLGESQRLFVIAVVTDEAVRIARERGLNEVDGDLFIVALYKGPFQDPYGRPCVDTANNIVRQGENLRPRLPDKINDFLRRLF